MKQAWILIIWTVCSFGTLLIPDIEDPNSILYYVNQCTSSFCLGFCLLLLNHWLPKGHNRQIWTIVCLTTIFSLYNVLTLIEYREYLVKGQYFYFDNYFFVQDAINLLELLTLITCTLVWLYGYSSRLVLPNPVNYLYRFVSLRNRFKSIKGNKSL